MKLLRDLVLSIVRPMLKFIGKIHLPFTRRKFTGMDYYNIRDTILPGDILLTSTRGEPTNLFNASEPNHGAIYVGGEGKCKYVIEALGQGVVKTDLVSFLMSKDDVVILRPLPDNKVVRVKACRFANEMIGKEYDYLFETGDDSYYCFELIIRAYQYACPSKNFSYSYTLREITYTAQDILRDTYYWEIYFDNRKKENHFETN